jgi:glycosyltransferase involved in cell wall biosynthesis
MNKDLTIVIPCKNEGVNIINVLKLIFRQRLDCQIIIADSSDDILSIKSLYDFVQRSHRLIKIIKGGLPSVARNNGAKLVKTPYVLFLDADIFITDKYLIKNCLFTAINGDYDLITCKFRTIGKGYNWVYRVFDTIQKITSITRPFAVGGFMLFKTETFNKLGGFDEKDKIAEDYRISSKIKPRKFKIINRYVYTTDRRFKKKGIWYMIKIMFLSWWNRNNEDWFKKDYNYWK